MNWSLIQTITGWGAVAFIVITFIIQILEKNNSSKNLEDLTTAIDIQTGNSSATQSIRDRETNNLNLSFWLFAATALSFLFAATNQISAYYLNKDQDNKNHELDTKLNTVKNSTDFFAQEYINQGNRALLTEQSDQLSKSLVKAKGDIVCVVEFIDPEPKAFAEQIISVLKVQEIEVRTFTIGRMTPKPVGIMVSNGNSAKINYFNAFKDAGLNPTPQEAGYAVSRACGEQHTSIIVGFNNSL